MMCPFEPPPALVDNTMYAILKVSMCKVGNIVDPRTPRTILKKGGNASDRIRRTAKCLHIMSDGGPPTPYAGDQASASLIKVFKVLG